MTLTDKEKALILSALVNDKVGSWGDGRQDQIQILIKKIKGSK
jgi:hypothetical protein